MLVLGPVLLLVLVPGVLVSPVGPLPGVGAFPTPILPPVGVLAGMLGARALALALEARMARIARTRRFAAMSRLVLDNFRELNTGK